MIGRYCVGPAHREIAVTWLQASTSTHGCPSPAGTFERVCPLREVKARLRRARLRPTRQRLALGWILFGKNHRHVTATQVYREAKEAGVDVSMATIYNTLKMFSDRNILKAIIVDSHSIIFDTDVSHHYHFYLTGDQKLVDIQPGTLDIRLRYKLPIGFTVSDVTLLVRVKDR